MAHTVFRLHLCFGSKEQVSFNFLRNPRYIIATILKSYTTGSWGKLHIFEIRWSGAGSPSICCLVHITALIVNGLVQPLFLLPPLPSINMGQIYRNIYVVYAQLQPQIENEDITWSPEYNLPSTRTNNHRVLSLQEVELDDWFLILDIVQKTCTIQFMHKFNMSFVFHFYILGLTSWIWTSLSTEGLKFESPSKWNAHVGFNLEHWLQSYWFAIFDYSGLFHVNFYVKLALPACCSLSFNDKK